MSTINTVTGTELALPSTNGKPTPPPRRDSIPMLELNVIQQTIQETVKDMDRQGSEDTRNSCRNKKQKTRSNFKKKKTLREVTQVKGLQYNRYLKDGLINCT